MQEEIKNDNLGEISLDEIQLLMEKDIDFRNEILSQVYDVEVPVDVRTFIESEEYLNGKETIYPSVISDMEEIFDPNSVYDVAVAIEGIGSGKTTKMAMALTYQVYKLGCMTSPQLYYHLRKDSRIALMNMSIRAQQARDVLFEDIKSFIDPTPWFRDNFMPDPRIRSVLRFPKGIYLLPGSSSDTFPHGYNVFSCVIDEAAHYTTMSHKGDYADQAKNMYGVLQRRRHSRFGSDGLTMVITSPLSVDDLTEELYAEGFTNPHIFGVKRPVWVAKPESVFRLNEFFVYDISHHRVVSENAREFVVENLDNPPSREVANSLSRKQLQYLVDLKCPPVSDLRPADNLRDEMHLSDEDIPNWINVESTSFDKGDKERYLKKRRDTLIEDAKILAGEDLLNIENLDEEDKEGLDELGEDDPRNPTYKFGK